MEFVGLLDVSRVRGHETQWSTLPAAAMRSQTGRARARVRCVRRPQHGPWGVGSRDGPRVTGRGPAGEGVRGKGGPGRDGFVGRWVRRL
ncbi:hypothetical protein GCM10010406_02870 [Streptomyces thermolineatus]|uniref:Uncharacterized protein n=1 Tax=Streptomyces thermolineatus TaxID=44033 RepID=A0ABN3KSK3_9ACTN